MNDYELPMAAAIEELQDDDTVDFESNQPQAEGWLKVYVECPECEVPMARTTVQHENVASPDDEARSVARLKAICPECHEMESLLTVHKTTKPTSEQFRRG